MGSSASRQRAVFPQARPDHIPPPLSADDTPPPPPPLSADDTPPPPPPFSADDTPPPPPFSADIPPPPPPFSADTPPPSRLLASAPVPSARSSAPLYPLPSARSSAPPPSQTRRSLVPELDAAARERLLYRHKVLATQYTQLQRRISHLPHEWTARDQQPGEPPDEFLWAQRRQQEQQEVLKLLQIGQELVEIKAQLHWTRF